jgi:alpha-glucosidase (family GH31 glycosyl hydrolase)
MMQYLYNQVPFSGIWLDMNEISNMCDGLCTPPKEEAIIDYTKDIPYTPGGGTIEQETISLNSTHFGKILEANVHPFFGLMHTYNSYEFMRQIRRPFLITRSHTFGSNRYGFHWTGDNYANFTFLKQSIFSNFMSGLWGIQMIGSDICGFGGNTTVEICSRFFQLGSLYPFSRNHNEFDAIDQ